MVCGIFMIFHTFFGWVIMTLDQKNALSIQQRRLYSMSKMILRVTVPLRDYSIMQKNIFLNIYFPYVHIGFLWWLNTEKLSIIFIEIFEYFSLKHFAYNHFYLYYVDNVWCVLVKGNIPTNIMYKFLAKLKQQCQFHFLIYL